MLIAMALTRVEVDRLAEGVIRPVMRRRGAAARRGPCVPALEGGRDIAALPRVRAVGGGERPIPDREPHAVELGEDLLDRIRDLLIHDDLADVRLPVEAVIAVADDAELRHPDGAAAMPLSRCDDRLLLGVREPRDAGLRRCAGGTRADGEGGCEADDCGDLHPPVMVPAIRLGRGQLRFRPRRRVE